MPESDASQQRAPEENVPSEDTDEAIKEQVPPEALSPEVLDALLPTPEELTLRLEQRPGPNDATIDSDIGAEERAGRDEEYVQRELEITRQRYADDPKLAERLVRSEAYLRKWVAGEIGPHFAS